MSTIKKVLYIVICIIIIAGIIVWKNNGFKLELQYSARNQINISNNTGININDVKQAVSEVLGNKRFSVQEVETFGNAVSIVSDEINEEQKNQIIQKINEKCQTDIDSNNIEIESIPFTRVKVIIEPVIIPGVIITIILLIYFLIRYKALSLKIILTKIVIIPVMVELLLYSVIALTKIPFGRLAIACGIGLYVITIAILSNSFENKREEKIVEKKDETERI